jgi:membrane dipeptidase
MKIELMKIEIRGDFMNYTDLHCDTALEIYLKKAGLCKNDLHVDTERAKVYDKYSQIFAVWSKNDKTDDENYEEFFKIRDYFIERCAESGIVLCETAQEYEENKNRSRAILAVEGAKLLSDDINRLAVLRRHGVRFLTLMWNGLCKIGGAFNTDEGLTAFGREAVKKCEELGIIIDISHSSDKTVADVFELASKPVIATHSNSRSVFGHKRNITDEQFMEIKKRGGIVGISLCSLHIGSEHETLIDDTMSEAYLDNPVYIKDVVRHIDYYMALGGENTVCFGCDFDGAPLPDDVKGISDVAKIAEEMKNIGYDDNLIENIMYKNADNFIANNL